MPMTLPRPEDGSRVGKYVAAATVLLNELLFWKPLVMGSPSQCIRISRLTLWFFNVIERAS